MKVLHLLNSRQFSGAENVVCQIVDIFRDDTLIDMVYCSPDGPIRKSLTARGIPYVSIAKMSIKEIKRIIKEQKPAIIHAHDFRASMIAVGATNNIPVISHLHNNAPWMSHYGLKSLSYALTCSRYCAILTVSDSVFDQYVFGNLFRSKLHVMGNPVNVRDICIRAKQYSADEYYDIGFCGRLTKQKNPFFFLEIVHRVKKELPTVRVAMIGDGEQKEQVELQISEKKLSDNIKLYGFVDNPYPILKNCGLLCMPSLWEGFGMVAIEALTLGVPVVCSGVGGLPGIVNDECGKLCKTKEDYVSEIIRLLTEPQYRTQKCVNAEKTSQTLDNMQEYGKHLRAIYHLAGTV